MKFLIFEIKYFYREVRNRILKLTVFYLDDSYLKYIGWTLHDKVIIKLNELSYSEER